MIDDPEAKPYRTQKLPDEKRFSVGCEASGVRLAVPRIFSLSGAFINQHDACVLASIVTSALSGAAVERRARRRLVRSDLAVRDLLDTSIGWLLAGREPDSTVLDTGGEIVEEGELALKVQGMPGRHNLATRRPPLGYEHDDVYLGDGSAFERLAAEHAIHLAPLHKPILGTAAYLKELRT